ncbi:7alpha-cephem-methoxylase P8 chain [Coccidioides immitis H538.4]|uniref:7alpha-cephem-methoxylase P8 chain n=1 Tax=Coccidioides immitis H538.4 TaxID=396776 RepID=A0A0J8U6X0_COCIT|nr:7alpha-cephem-methoxylase P8 chain [Coccidioides immitis H538.4]
MASPYISGFHHVDGNRLSTICCRRRHHHHHHGERSQLHPTRARRGIHSLLAPTSRRLQTILLRRKSTTRPTPIQPHRGPPEGLHHRHPRARSQLLPRRDAFQALQNVPPTKADPSFTDDANIKSVYYPEVEDLILTHVPGATRVVIFDHTIRRSNPDAPRGPVTRAHVDQTPYSAAERVKYHLPADEAEQLLRGRYRIINVWRPLNGPVQDMPLAFASSLSVDDADLVPVEHRYPDRTGETATVLYAPTQKWYYWSGIGGDERLLLKCSDSKEGAPGKRVPHTAFVDPRTPVGARGRESIEVRCLVFG